MAKRLKLTDRSQTSDAFIYSCRAFVNKDIDTAFLWAMKVLEHSAKLSTELTENEQIYINDVIRRKKRKNRRK